MSSVLSITQDYLQSNKGVRKLLVKPMETGVSWVKFFHPNPPQGLKDMKTFLGRFNKVLSLSEYPEKVEKFFHEISRFKKARKKNDWWRIGETGSRIFYANSKLISPVTDIVKRCDRAGAISLSSGQMLCLGYLGLYSSLSMFVSSFFSSMRLIVDLTKAESLFDYVFIGIKVVYKVAKFFLGLLGIIHFVVCSQLVAPWVLLALSTTVLITGILKYYCDKISDIELAEISWNPI